jgi:hypothetical protein
MSGRCFSARTSVSAGKARGCLARRWRFKEKSGDLSDFGILEGDRAIYLRGPIRSSPRQSTPTVQNRLQISYVVCIAFGT